MPAWALLQGFYFNELTGNVSSAELTLRGFVPTVGSTPFNAKQ